MTFARFFLTTSCSIAALGSLPAETAKAPANAPAEVKAALPATPALAEPALASVQFTGPEVVKLDWTTRCPRAADFNGDGLTDLAVLNLDRSRIEFLLQRKEGVQPGKPEQTSRKELWNPILEISRFEKAPFVVGRATHALAVADFHGDGRADVAYTTDEHLVIRHHGKEMADWNSKREWPLSGASDASDSLITADLNADGRADLALLTDSRLLVYLQRDKGEWADAQTYALSQKNVGGLQAADVDSDGRMDLLCTSSEADALLLRLQGKDGAWGEEWRIETQPGRAWMTPVRLGKKTGLAMIHNATGMVEISQLAMAKSAAETDAATAIRHAIPPSDGKGSASAYGDITGDGFADVVIAEPKRARLWIFAGSKDGRFGTATEYPALSGISALAIADLDGDSKAELALLSPDEKCLAIARWSKGRLAYPEIIHQTEDTLLAMTAGLLADAKSASLLAITEAKSKSALLALAWSAKDKKFTASTTELTGAPSKINGLRLADADQDGRGDLILFSSLAASQVLLSRADAKAPWKKGEGLPESFMTKLTPTAITEADMDGDGKAELVIAREALARAVRFDAAGKAKIIEQFNAPEASALLSCALVVATADGKGRRVLLIDSAAKKLHELIAGADGVYRSQRSLSLSAMPLDGVRALPSAAGLRLLLQGRTSFEIMPLEGQTLKLERLASFTTELKDTQPNDLLAASFTGGDSDDLMLLDTKKSRILEFYRSRSAGHREWQSFCYFRVFQSDPFYKGKSGYEYEPHDYAALDMNGDGKADLCLLTHDRLLLYVQE